MGVQLRISYVLLLTGLWLVLGASSSSAQTIGGGGGLQEWEFNGDGSACSDSNALADDNIVWGTEVGGATHTSCSDASQDDNIVWGTGLEGGDDNIVWGTLHDDDNIVWGTEFEGDDNIVWGTRATEAGQEY